MNFTAHCSPSLEFPQLLPYADSKAPIFPYPNRSLIENPSIHIPIKRTQILSKNRKNRKSRIRAAFGKDAGTGNWANLIPQGALAGDKVFRLISGATASPICQFIPSPKTFLHPLDPRIKLGWLLALVIIPARTNIIMRFGLVTYLACLSVWVLPGHMWMDQLGRVTLLCGILFIMLGFGSDSVPPLVQLRTPPPAMVGLPTIPVSLEGYSYIVAKLGPFQLTRKGLSVGSASACLTFIIFQSTSLCLTTTTPEQLASALRWFMLPLTFLGVPLSEIILTLMLSLRFINLVFDEVRNVALAIVSRRITWKHLTIMETIDIFIAYARRIFKNIFSHAEQISQAMIARGFRGDSSYHKIFFLQDSSLGMADAFSLLCLMGLVGAAIMSEYAFS